LGRSYPIVHGALHFDGRHAREVNDAASDFFRIAGLLNVEDYWLALNTCNDLIFRIFARLREEGLVSDGEEAG